MNNNLVTDSLGKIRLYNGDCTEWMKSVPDNYYELAIVDPPYGININESMGRRKGDKHSGRKKSYWDNEIPKKDYFDELFRISQNRIVWGANYFMSEMPYNSKCWIIWDKMFSEKVSFSQFEMAWTSFDSTSKKIEISPQSMKNRIHNTEKPIKLYEWLLTNYAKQGDKIFDSHFGSLSIGIACHNLGFELDACELDKEYYQSALERLKRHQAQQTLFMPNEIEKQQVEQLRMF